MPVMHFHVRWPDGEESVCYSPSLVIRDYLTPGTDYPLTEFVGLCRQALHIASERVREKFGFACSQALDQLALIEHRAIACERSAPGGAAPTVRVLRFT